jgi:cysteine sulfinate desulfinase/cysteine desulfurase-like protein
MMGPPHGSVAGGWVQAIRAQGSGALFIRSRVNLEKPIHGAGQESSWRAGMENIIEVVRLAGLGRLLSSLSRSGTVQQWVTR